MTRWRRRRRANRGAMLPLSRGRARPDGSGPALRDLAREHPEASLADVCYIAGAGRSHFEHRAAWWQLRPRNPAAARGSGGRPPAAPACCAAGAPTRRPQPGSSPARAASIQGWRASCSTPSRCSPTRSAAARAVDRSCRVRCWMCCCPPTARPWRRCGTPRSPSRRSSPWRWVWPDCGGPGSRTGRRAGAQRRPVRRGLRGQGVFSLEDGARLIAERGPGCSAASPPAAGWWRCSPTPSMWWPPRRASRGCPSARTTDATRCSPARPRIWSRSSPPAVRTAPAAWLETSPRLPLRTARPVLDEFGSPSQNNSASRRPRLPLVCNRTGAVPSAETPLNAQYWRKHSRQRSSSPRRRHRRRARLLGADGDRPQPILTAAALQTWPESAATPSTIVSLRKGRQRTAADDRNPGRRLSSDTGRTSPRAKRSGRRLELPTYPFQRRRYWPNLGRGRHRRRRRCRMSGILGSAGIWPPATPSTAHRTVGQDPAVAVPSTSSRHGGGAGRDLRHHGAYRSRGAGAGQESSSRADHPAGEGRS